MSPIRTVTAADFADDCPVPSSLLSRLIHADAGALHDLLDAIPEGRRVRLAVYLYGRSHTHALGVRIAAVCDEAILRREAGIVGAALYDLSRQPYAGPAYGTRSDAVRRISLGGAKGRVAA